LVSLKKGYHLVFAVTVLVFVVMSGAAAQFVSLENRYIGASVGQFEDWDLACPPFCHWQIDGQPIAGRFCLWTVEGDPTVPDDDGSEIVYTPFTPTYGGPGDKWGAVQIMVDSWDDEEGVHQWATFERGETSGIWGDPEDGFWSLMPYVPTNEHTIIGAWYPVSSDDTLNRGIGYIPVRVEQRVKLMRDQARFEWIITNEDTRDHLVGLRIYADLVASPDDSGTRELRNVVSIPGRPLLEDRIVLSGRDIPPAIEIFNSQREPVQSIRLTFSGSGATPPDKVGIDEWFGGVTGSTWTYWYDLTGQSPDPFVGWSYEPVPHHYIGDLAYGAFWKPRRIPAGHSRTIIHYIGLACATADMTEPNVEHAQYVAAVQGPRTLKYYSPMGVGRLYPEPFTISAYLENTEKYTDLNDASFTLILPPGLTLDSSETQYTKTLTGIGAGTEGSVSWLVRPDGNPTGILSYSVSFSAAPVGGTNVTREINIPATETQSFSSRWQMISVPFDLTNTEPASALGIVGTYAMWRYDPFLRKYMPVYELVAGEAYWLWLTNRQTTSMTVGEYAPIEWAGTQGYQIPLETGWNLVGNPYLYAVTLGEVRFYYRDYGNLLFDDAVERGLISPALFWWDPIFRRYNWSTRRTAQVKPWQGYWLRALRPGVTMIITPVSQIGANIGGVPPEEDNGGPQPPPTP